MRGMRVVGPLFYSQHPFQCNQAPFADLIGYLDGVNWRPLLQVFQGPAQVRQIDSIHRRTHTNDGAEEMDFLLGVLRLEPINEVQFGPNRPLGPRRTLLNGFDDLARAARDIC